MRRTRNFMVIALFRIFAVGYFVGLVVLAVLAVPHLFYFVCYGVTFYVLVVVAKLTIEEMLDTFNREEGPYWLPVIANDVSFMIVMKCLPS